MLLNEIMEFMKIQFHHMQFEKRIREKTPWKMLKDILFILKIVCQCMKLRGSPFFCTYF